MLAFRPAEATDSPVRVRRAVSTEPAAATKSADVPSSSGTSSGDPWRAMIAALDTQGAARQLAINCTLLAREEGRLRLLLDPRGTHFRTNQTEETPRACAESACWGLRCSCRSSWQRKRRKRRRASWQQAAEERLQAARVELENDPTVRALMERLSATLIADSVKPLN